MCVWGWWWWWRGCGAGALREAYECAVGRMWLEGGQHRGPVVPHGTALCQQPLVTSPPSPPPDDGVPPSCASPVPIAPRAPLPAAARDLSPFPPRMTGPHHPVLVPSLSLLAHLCQQLIVKVSHHRLVVGLRMLRKGDRAAGVCRRSARDVARLCGAARAAGKRGWWWWLGRPRVGKR
eukprot:343279-Chlamydomonas_euryale.AAC.2